LLIELIKQWERARLLGVFPSTLKKEMENLDNEYHLESVSENSWKLFPIGSNIFNHTKKVRQPGGPLSSTFNFENKFNKQPLIFTIKLDEETTCRNIEVELDNYKKVTFPITLSKSQMLRYEGSNQATLYDKNWNVIRTINVDIKSVEIEKGNHSLTVDCDFLSNEKSKIKIEIKTIGEPIMLAKK